MSPALDEYVLLGRTGLRVSRLALGAMTFGTEWGFGCDQATAQRLFDTYLAAGGNFIDTADVYTAGTSERWLGQFIRERACRDRIVLATKFGFTAELGNPNAGGNQRKNILRALEGSLQRLDTDYIDLYILHVWDRLTPPEEVLRTLDDLIRAGRIRHYALSDVPAWYATRMQTLAEARGLEPVAALQLEYSLAQRSIEREHLPAAQALGMGVMAWSPLASGLLSGKYRAAGGAVSGRLTAGGLDATAALSARHHDLLVALGEVAEALDRPMAQVALNWLANRPGVTSVIVGATRPEQLEANLACLGFTLPEGLTARLEAASRPASEFPQTLFSDPMQRLLTGNTTVSRRPSGHDASPRVERGEHLALPFIAAQAAPRRPAGE
ncbi:MAG: aldo/keto reductase [Gammaproteobacteria bacterium]|nr:aldo/keto reductase [Gammaproteobacteria bacterium]TVQ43992.1 MAG: aldo/keto reductase [Gammaproteobacteria bacterium]